MIASLNELKALVNIQESDTSKDALLNRLLASAQEYAERRTGRGKFEQATTTLTTEGDGASFIYLPQRPVVLDVSGTNYVHINGVDTPTASVEVYGDKGKVVLSNGYKFTEGKKVEINYSGGYAPGDVPADLVNLVLEIAAATYRERGGVLYEKKVGDVTVKYSVERSMSQSSLDTLEFYTVSQV